jgi:hypothetical protein
MQPYRGSGLDQKSMQLQAPRDPRSLFELFATYDPARGLDELLASLDVTGLEPRHIYHSILGRRPETLQATKRPEHYNPRDHMRGALVSPEFQRKVIPLILNAYPEKQRLLFIHVPKCAGTDLRIGLSTRYPALDVGLGRSEWTSTQQLFAAIHEVALGLRFSDTILLHGHIRIAAAINGGMVRPTDRIITVIRDPVEIILSNVNYVITRILQDQEIGKEAPDTQGWRRTLGIDRLPAEISDEVAVGLFNKMLHNPAIAVPNSICYWLGNGDVQSAIRRLVINDVEITDTRHYAGWLRGRWDVVRATKANESRKFITAKHIQSDDRKFVEGITADDREVYALLSKQIEASGHNAIFGRDIAEIDRFK